MIASREQTSPSGAVRGYYPMSEQAEQTTDKSADRKVQTRARVWRACEVCRKRKVKCNGQEPCAYCLSSGKICSFKDINDNAASARQQQTNSVEMRLSRVEETLQKFVPMVQAFESWLRTNSPSTALPFHIDSDPPSSETPYRVRSPSSTEPYRPSTAIRKLSQNDVPTYYPQVLPSEPPEQNPSDIPEKWSDRTTHLTKDSYGHLRYTGGASSYMLVDALTTLQNPTTEASPESNPSNKTSDIQLPFFNPNRRFRTQESLPRPEDIVYPTPELADELVTTYFKRIHYTFPILHQHTFVDRYMKVMEEKLRGKPSKDHAFLSALFAVFACGACLTERARPKSRGTDEGKCEFGGLEFYERAQLLFWMGQGSSQIEHVQSLAIMAICNASWNTLAQSWINAGSAIRRAQDLGLHRSGRRLPLTPFEREIRRRIWWCTYGLDRVLSIALGRPSGAHDDDCDVEMPSELDDAQLLAARDGVSVTASEKSYMIGFVALLGIYKIAGKIMRFVQSPRIDDQRSEQTRKIVMELDAELANWINTIPPSIRFAANDSSNPQLLSLCLIAFFVYYSAIINLHRPFIPDYPTTSSDLSSLGHCLGAARSCIRIGEITQEMLPSSHHLAFAVQYITLSAVLLLRSIAYVNQPDLVSAIVTDAEKSIKILEGMENIWPASKRCREIVSDLLVVFRTKLYGGTQAIEALQAAQQRPQDPAQQGSQEERVPPQHNGIPSERKRKRTPDAAPIASSSRQRLDDHRQWAPGSNLASGRHFPSSNERGHFPDSDPNDSGPYTQRLSSLRTSSVRTSMEGERGSPMASPSENPASRHNYSDIRHEAPPASSSAAPFAEELREHAREISALPQISLDINGLNNRHEIDGFSGYDFLGDDLFALLGSVVRPSATQPSPQTFEENAQVLWQAYRGQSDVPFAGE